MTRETFTNLCTLPETRGRLIASTYLKVDEQVAIFLHTLAHDDNSTSERWKWFKVIFRKLTSLYT